MKKTTLFCALAMTAVFAGHAEAIYKCTTPKGVVYQDRPCKEGAESDVTIVIPTGELAPKAVSAQDDPPQANAVRPDNRSGAQNPGRTGNEHGSAASRANATSSNAASTRAVVESLLPLTAEEARKTEPTAKYYTTDAAVPGAETPQHMTCESPTGEKRRFILTNGKMTSI